LLMKCKAIRAWVANLEGMGGQTGGGRVRALKTVISKKGGVLEACNKISLCGEGPNTG